MEDPKLPPGPADTQAAAEELAASYIPPAAQDIQPPAGEADAPPHSPPTGEAEAPPQPPPLGEADAPPQPPPAGEADAHPPPAYADEAPQPPTPPSAAQAPPPTAAAAPLPSPPPASATQLSMPPSAETMDLPSRGKKRPLECNFQIENSKYFKMRLLLRDLRPHFVELLRTPDFKNSKAAKEIQEKMKLMLELYRQMTGETAKRDNTHKIQSLPNGSVLNRTPQDASAKSAEMRSLQTGSFPEKHRSEGSDNAGGPVVGGSAFGWNFITSGGTEPVYYGTTKAEYRSSHPITEGE